MMVLIQLAFQRLSSTIVNWRSLRAKPRESEGEGLFHRLMQKAFMGERA